MIHTKTIQQNSLAFWLDHDGRNQRALAVELGISDGQISRLVNGKAQPSLRLSKRIQDATGGAVKMESWV